MAAKQAAVEWTDATEELGQSNSDKRTRIGYAYCGMMKADWLQLLDLKIDSLEKGSRGMVREQLGPSGVGTKWR
jgi:hypothetical protein